MYGGGRNYTITPLGNIFRSNAYVKQRKHWVARSNNAYMTGGPRMVESGEGETFSFQAEIN